MRGEMHFLNTDKNDIRKLDPVTMPSSYLNHQVRWWFGYRMADNVIGLYKKNTFSQQWHQIP